MAAEGTLKRGVTSIDAGRLGRIAVAGDQVVLGKPLDLHEGEHRPIRFLSGLLLVT